MSSRRQVLSALAPSPTTHAGLWLDKGLLDVAGEGGHHQEHFEGLMRSIRVPETYNLFFARWREQLAAVPCSILVEARVKGRMIVGLGSESILETGITLNHTYGVPYLPGSSLKGLAAATAHKKLEDADWRKGDGASHRILFGDQESSGYVTFHDALWIPESDRLPFDLDVMTVHHPKYYQGEAIAPSGMESPVPVAFLTTRGRFLLAVSGPEVWARTALTILRDALRDEGLGAKTAAGYGRFESFEIPGESAENGSASESGDWLPGRLLYHAGPGELEATLANNGRARASRLQSQELLATLPEALRAALQKRKQPSVEVRVQSEGLSLRLVAIRPVGSGA